jgi:hypothetical protein
MRAMPAKKTTTAESLDSIFERLSKLLSEFSPPFEIYSRSIPKKRDFNIRVPKPVSIPGAYGGKPVQIDLACLILQKGYVGFYFMPLYVDSGLRKKISPSLLKLLKGKTCFHIKNLDDAQLANIEFALREGMKRYQGKGWL